MIIGHQKIISFLDRSLQKDSLDHAYLFCGPEHVGKFVVALDLARKILGDVTETNPDLIVLKPEVEEKKGIIKKKAINIEAIRDTQRKIYISPLGGKHKIVIIDDAEYLNISSQNALLKILEEPPENVIIILTASNHEKLLPTIISRCHVKRFHPVSGREIAEALGLGADREDMLFWSLGRPGLAVGYMNDKKEWDATRDDLEELRKIISSNLADKFSLAETWSKDTVMLVKKLSLWMVLIRQSLLGRENILPLSRQKSLIVIEKLGSALEALKNTNSNPRLILENIMLEI